MKEFKLIVAGSRDFNDYDLLRDVVMSLADHEYGDRVLSIVSGMARGADALGVVLAAEQEIHLYAFPADWSLGKGAGHIRNRQMGDFADGLVAFWDGRSSGTKGMIEYMQKLKKPVHIHNYGSTCEQTT